MTAEDATRRAQDSYQRDRRFRAMVGSVAHEAYLDFDDEAPFLAIHAAAALMLQRIYEEDAELTQLRAERDHYRDIALKGLSRTPAPLVILEEQKDEPR